MSRLRTLIEAGGPVVMVNPGGAALDVVDMLGRLGAKCVFIDCERTAVGLESVAPLARCAQRYGMAAVVRSESAHPETLVRYLDRDIDAIVVPHVESIAAAQSIAQTVHYVTRGECSRVFTVAQIESVAGVEHAEALATVPGIDGVLIGPNDLAHSMGFGGDTNAPAVQAAVESVADIVQAHRRPWGLPVSPATCPRWVARGAQLLYVPLEAILRTGWSAYQPVKPA